MIERFAEGYLSHWLTNKYRKPLIIRGARQVGKSTLVREFARKNGLRLVEVNMGKAPHLDRIFSRNDVGEILKELSLVVGTTVGEPGRTILFLDEIQAAPSALPALRYFHEDRPDLPVVAAGSLLDFSLKTHGYSMPVGRIQYMHLGPVTFLEYVRARGPVLQEQHLRHYRPSAPFSAELHRQMLRLLREFMIIGGMPEPVSAFVTTSDFSRAIELQHGIVDTYRDDSAKYARSSMLPYLQKVFDSVPSAIGEKFSYSNVNPSWQSRDIRKAVDMLSRAGVIACVHTTTGDGLPFAAHRNDKVFKPHFVDIGLMNAGLGVRNVPEEELVSQGFVNKGKMAEQFIAQHLRYPREPFPAPELYYWLRDGRKGKAEVDFLTQCGQRVVPVEVKAGKTGSLKSLHLYCGKYGIPRAVRLNTEAPSITEVDHKLPGSPGSKDVRYALVNLPLYMVELIPEMVSAAGDAAPGG